MSKVLIYSQEDLDLILELEKEKNEELQQENQQLKDRDLIIAAELTKLQDENIRLKKDSQKQKEVIDKAIEYLETKRIREKAIIDIDVLEGILKEVE